MNRFAGLCLAVLLGATMAEAKEEAASEIVLRGDRSVAAMVVRGDREYPVRLVVDGASPGRPILNPKLVQRAGIGKSLIGGGFLIGPVKLSADTRVVKYRFGDYVWKRRSLWTDRAYEPDHDGGVGPLGIPYDIVRIEWREPQPEERICSMKLHNNGHAVARIERGGKTIDISFTAKRGPSLSTAAAGAVIAESNGGKFSGELGRVPIAYGITRPIRRLALADPLTLCGVSLESFYVRTRDFGDSSGIADGDLERANSDSSEIVVVGKRGKKDRNSYFLAIGQDDLRHCSSITYDKPAGEIRLSCGVG
ncbi:MAG: hypothetical protein AAFX04_09150 [Pseudomonadota bacterium]